tara:strand:+ start:91 stop:411 length:321 start_codon:yes stop_codon:yes gene_type:complete
MEKWTNETEEKLTLLIKEWLKNQGRTQVDLKESLQALSSRMPALIEVLKKEYSLGGIAKVAEKLCSIENDWSQEEQFNKVNQEHSKNDPFNQLDLLLEELQEDCKN